MTNDQITQKAKQYALEVYPDTKAQFIGGEPAADWLESNRLKMELGFIAGAKWISEEINRTELEK